MNKILLKTNEDLKNAINFFGKEWKQEIKEEIKEFPCVLVSFYADDIEFGEIYRFTIVSMEDFQ